MADLEATLQQVEDAKKTGKFHELSQRDIHAAEDDDFLQSLFAKFATNGKDGIKTISKDNARLAAAQCLQKWHSQSEQEAKEYLD